MKPNLKWKIFYLNHGIMCAPFYWQFSSNQIANYSCIVSSSLVIHSIWCIEYLSPNVDIISFVGKPIIPYSVECMRFNSLHQTQINRFGKGKLIQTENFIKFNGFKLYWCWYTIHEGQSKISMSDASLCQSYRAISFIVTLISSIMKPKHTKCIPIFVLSPV